MYWNNIIQLSSANRHGHCLLLPIHFIIIVEPNSWKETKIQLSIDIMMQVDNVCPLRQAYDDHSPLHFLSSMIHEKKKAHQRIK